MTRGIALGLYDKFNAMMLELWPEAVARRVDLNLGHSQFMAQLPKFRARGLEDLAFGRETMLRLHLHKDTKDQPCDAEVASGVFDDRIHALELILREVKATITVGPECNGWWNKYTPAVFPQAFRRIMNIIPSERTPAGLCYEPSAPFDIYDPPYVSGATKYHPGANYVQILEVDLYTKSAMSGPLTTANGALTKHGRAVGFCAKNKEKVLAVRVPECGMSDVGVENTDEAIAWIDALFDFLILVKADRLYWNNVDYREQKFQDTDWAKGWQDGCLNHNPVVADHFVKRAHEWILAEAA